MPRLMQALQSQSRTSKSSSARIKRRSRRRDQIARSGALGRHQKIGYQIKVKASPGAAGSAAAAKPLERQILSLEKFFRSCANRCAAMADARFSLRGRKLARSVSSQSVRLKERIVTETAPPRSSSTIVPSTSPRKVPSTSPSRARASAQRKRAVASVRLESPPTLCSNFSPIFASLAFSPA